MEGRKKYTKALGREYAKGKGDGNVASSHMSCKLEMRS